MTHEVATFNFPEDTEIGHDSSQTILLFFRKQMNLKSILIKWNENIPINVNRAFSSWHLKLNISSLLTAGMDWNHLLSAT